jgi:hypothetical protein
MQPAGGRVARILFHVRGAIVHFDVANLVYLGEVFPGDGYPAIDPNALGWSPGGQKALYVGMACKSLCWHGRWIV